MGSSPSPSADHLAHHAEAAGARHGSGVRRQLAGDDLEQRRLAGSVGADQRDLGALTDAERDVVEQHAAVRQLVPDPLDVDVSHKTSILGTPTVNGPRLTPREGSDRSTQSYGCWSRR